MKMVHADYLAFGTTSGLGEIRYFHDEGSNVMYMQQLIPGRDQGKLTPILKPDGVSLLTYDEWREATSNS